MIEFIRRVLQRIKRAFRRLLQREVPVVLDDDGRVLGYAYKTESNTVQVVFTEIYPARGGVQMQMRYVTDARGRLRGVRVKTYALDGRPLNGPTLNWSYTP